MQGTQLTKQDEKNAYTIKWLSNYIFENTSSGVCKNYAEDILDLITDILTDDDDHFDQIQEDPSFVIADEEKSVLERTFVKEQISGKVAIVIGHNKNTGAVTHDGTDEWESRKLVAEALQDFLGSHGVDSKIFIRDGRLSYGSAMRKHGKNIDAYGADVAIELHFNSAGATATGAEFICCSSSGAKVARSIADSWKVYYPDMVLRRDDGVYMRTNGRGSGFCRSPKCPAIVYEPFFGSNPKDWAKFEGFVEKEAQALGTGIINWIKKN